MGMEIMTKLLTCPGMLMLSETLIDAVKLHPTGLGTDPRKLSP